ncbi:MAG: 3-deoxy-D-manno-octulosonic acid transferase [Candidatus Rokuibacteriota bacterium]|nr:MAG: 3-deoxy-D-manno-octulosonic acid transferase [Candidatus Rokubacteria bacterium]
MIYPVYSALVATALVAGYGPAAVARYLAHGVPLNLRERLGYTGRETARMPHGWLHAVSVGEAIAAAPIVAGVRGLYPDLPLVMTTVTATGAHVVRERYRADVEHRYLPLDLPGAVRRVTATIDPAFLILMETELWPNLLRHLCRLEVPVMVANGRLSDRSFPRYRLARPFVQKVLDCVTVFAMQSEEDARRAVALGARPDRVFVTGNVKADAVADQTGSKERWRGLLGLAPAQRAWVAGSTHAGEEDALLDAHAVLRREVSDLVLVLAPRHPERVSDVLRRIAARGWDAVRRSELPRPKAADTVIVLDTVGELAELYAIAEVVFVGGSLVPAGGHNVLEPAQREKPVLFGPHTENFREATSLLLDRGGAIRVQSSDDLARELGRLLRDEPARAKLGRAAWEAAHTGRGSVRDTLALVTRFLSPRERS